MMLWDFIVVCVTGIYVIILVNYYCNVLVQILTIEHVCYTPVIATDARFEM